jgi:hypothetical protein
MAQIGLDERREFFQEYKAQSPLLCLLLMLVSAGIYAFVWIFEINRYLEKLDEDAPDSRRGAVILFFFPFFGWLFFLAIEYLIIGQASVILELFAMVYWLIFGFLSLRYTYDFCMSFANLTRSSGLLWYFFLYPGYVAMILIFFDFYYVIPLALFPFMIVPAMQVIMNKNAERFRAHLTAENFNNASRKGLLEP